jgi:threonine dehydrogenase-like Zn-dependent dehydrogenase
MKALCWHGKEKVSVDDVPDPQIRDPRDIIIKVTTTAICGSDLHLYGGMVPTMEAGDIIGHEPMGEVVEVGKNVRTLNKGDRVVVPFTISCGECFFCRKGLFSLCDTTNPNRKIAEKMMGHSPAGLFGYSHMLGGYPGGQAQYLRVPYADVGPIKIPEGLRDEQVLFLSDIFPTGYMGAENCGIEKGDTVNAGLKLHQSAGVKVHQSGRRKDPFAYLRFKQRVAESVARKLRVIPRAN